MEEIIDGVVGHELYPFTSGFFGYCRLAMAQEDMK